MDTSLIPLQQKDQTSANNDEKSKPKKIETPLAIVADGIKDYNDLNKNTIKVIND